MKEKLAALPVWVKALFRILLELLDVIRDGCLYSLLMMVGSAFGMATFAEVNCVNPEICIERYFRHPNAALIAWLWWLILGFIVALAIKIAWLLRDYFEKRKPQHGQPLPVGDHPGA